MLSKQRCPYTGIVNYFTAADPLLSVGSIIEAGESKTEYHWRWYGATKTVSGISDDMKSAEERLVNQHRQSGVYAHA